MSMPADAQEGTQRPDRPPAHVRRAFLAYSGALGIGILSWIVGMGMASSLAAELGRSVSAGSDAVSMLQIAFRLLTTVVAGFALLAMREGSNPARITLIVLGWLGVIGNVAGILAAQQLFRYARIYGVSSAYGGVSVLFSITSEVLLLIALFHLHGSRHKAYFR